MEIVGLTVRATSFIHRLQLQPEIYHEFKRVMRDYSTDKLNVAAVVSELDTLFRFHPHLLNEYRIFLSPQLPSPQQSPVTQANLDILKRCIHFMNKVQTRFANERGVIVAYLEIIRALKQGKICNIEAYNAVARIFSIGNEDLIDAFEELVFGTEGIKRKKKRRRNNGDESEALKPISKEDKMFELDLNLHLRKTTVESVNKLMESLEKGQHQIININEYLSAVSLGYIRKEYKEEGKSIITRLREDPRRVLPKILEKLESKEEVLIKVWRDLHEKKRKLLTKYVNCRYLN